MRIILLFVFLISYLSFGNLIYSQIKWYRGSIHVHSTYSDGQLSPDSLISLYKSKGYDFIVISDHNRLTDGEKLSLPDFLLINGEEITFSMHIGGIGLSKVINPAKLNLEQIIYEVASQNAIPIINHPIWKPTRFYYKDIISLNYVKHFEIYNAYTDSVGHHDDLSLWDSLLTHGKKIYGVASDDAHFPQQIGHGWIGVRATSLSRDNVLNAIKKGEFYSSSGIIISDMVMQNNKITVTSLNGETIHFIGKNGELLKSFDGKSATYDISGDEDYVRIEISNHFGQKAWSQPLLGKFERDTLMDPSNDDVGGSINIQNYPNPFTDGTTIEYTLPTESAVKINIYNMLGEIMETVIENVEQSGSHKAIISSSKYPSGLYICKLQTHSMINKGNFTVVRKMICVK
jgi:predicted metal-dependent phosphoesterase TrpH